MGRGDYKVFEVLPSGHARALPRRGWHMTRHRRRYLAVCSILAWPRIFCTVARSIPASSMSVTAVWRRRCGPRPLDPSSSFAGHPARSRLRSRLVPAGHGRPVSVDDGPGPVRLANWEAQRSDDAPHHTPQFEPTCEVRVGLDRTPSARTHYVA